MKTRHPERFLGFTLIELLVVITIMGIVAALIVSAGQKAMRAKKDAAVTGMREKLSTMIDHYQSKLNFYPPDNGNLAMTNRASYDAIAAMNPLIYELTGGTNYTNTAAVFSAPGMGNILPMAAGSLFVKVFNRAGIANSDTTEPQDFYIPGPQPQDYTNYPGCTNIFGLLVPVPAVPNGGPTNFWHYDSSSQYRHNQNSYDLWAEYYVGTAKNGLPLIITNGNW
jgi:prepilin-type N-terminal cleavage/methylation domain-containing protein